MTTFGLQIPNFTLGVPDDQLFDKVVELAQTAEDVGFESVWVMDHLYQLPPLGGPDQPMLEAYTLLGALAARTTKVKLGTLVTGVTYRNPGLLAKIITTLDIISRGRAILGIGAAWYDVEHEGLGFEFPPVKERMDRLEEAVQICRAMFRDDKVSFEGKHYAIREARNLPRPIQAGGPEIMIGGGGEKRTLKLVAQYADMCNVVGDPAGIRHKIDVIQRHCKDVGRDPTEVKITRMATMMITDSPEQTEQTREFLTAAAGAEAAAAFTFGQEDEIVAQVEELIDAGVDTFIFNMPMSDAAGVRRAGELLTARFS
jgi:F420-dependent oxidoreductase-like protein